MDGPGLQRPLQLGGREGWTQGEPIAVLVEGGGFFQAVWGGNPDALFERSPTQKLGPRYRLVYRLPGPSGKVDRVRQDVYPYAQGGLLTYTPPSQPFFDSRRTRGGWFRADLRVKDALVAAGLPVRAPQTPIPDSDAPTPPFGLVALIATVGLAGIAALALRRHARPASA